MGWKRPGWAMLPRGIMAGATVAVVLLPLAACADHVAGGSKAAGARHAAGGVTASAKVDEPGDGSDTIMIIRHGEKPAGSQKSSGVDATGSQSPGSLSVRGWQRAGALVGLFDPAAADPIRAGLSRPRSIYAAKPDGDAGQRPSQTVTPLADRLGLTVNTTYAKGNVQALVQDITAVHGTVLVCWQHEEIPALAAALGPVTTPVPTNWPDDRFDLVWAFTRVATGWSFRQVPQLLLAGDHADPISS